MAKLFDFDARTGSLIDKVNNEYPTKYLSPKIFRGDKGFGVELDESGKYLTFPNTDNRYVFSNGTNDLPFSANYWGYVGNTSANVLFGIWDSSTLNRTWQISVFNGILYFYLYSTTPTFDDPLWRFDVSSYLDKTIHISVSYDGLLNSDSVTLKINNNTISLYNYTFDVGYITMTPPSTISELKIGFQGIYQICNRLQIYDTVLTTEEIDADYNEFKKSQIIDPPKLNYVDTDADLVAFWNMKPKGGKVKDWSGNGNDGTIGDGIISRDGGLYFNGSGNKIDIGEITEINNSTILSFQIVIKKDADDKIICFGSGDSSSDGIWLSWFSDGRLYFNPRNGGGAYSNYYSLTWENNFYYHIVGVYDGTQAIAADRLRLYVNGELKTTILSGNPPTSLSSTAGKNFQIGNLDFFGSFPNTGIIRDIRIYNRILSQTEITALYNSAKLY